MKREDLLRYLRSQGCELKREGGVHSIGVNLQGKTQAVPRHTEIEEFLARAICRKLGLDAPGRWNQ
jgi:predicted RNA binding protein YcfA (HicA-like mRNA interferase family)